MKLNKGTPLSGCKAFVEACQTCKNIGSNLCKKCKMEVESGYDPKPEFAITNADRIRAMSDELLANWLDYMYGRCDWCDTNKVGTDDCSDIACTDCIFEWLKQPAEGE